VFRRGTGCLHLQTNAYPPIDVDKSGRVVPAQDEQGACAQRPLFRIKFDPPVLLQLAPFRSLLLQICGWLRLPGRVAGIKISQTFFANGPRFKQGWFVAARHDRNRSVLIADGTKHKFNL